MPDNIVEHIRESFYLLQLWRRCYREIPTSLDSFDAIQKYVMCNTLPLHKTGNGMQGILYLDIHKSKDIIATGGADGNTIVSDQVSGNFICSLEAHSKQVTCLKFVEKDELLVTGSADSTVRVWKQSDDRIYNFKHMLDDHTAEVYSASADSWREFQGPVLGNKLDEDEEDQFQRNYYAVVNRTVYFCNGDEQQLITFDLHKEGFGLVSFPSFVQRKWSDVLDFKGSVAVVFESVSGVDLWTLDDDVS